MMTTVPYLPLAKARSTLHMTSTVASMEDPSEGKETSSGGDGTMSALMFNLVKSVVGAGVLSLPAGAYHALLSLHQLYMINDL